MNEMNRIINEECPSEVKFVTLGSLCSLVTKQTGFDYSNHIKPRLLMEREENSVPYIQTKFFTGKRFDYNTDYYVPMDIVERFPKITLDERCLLFSIVGASIGNVGLFPGEETCFLGGAICVAKVRPEYNIDYIYYCIESSYVQEQIKKKTKGAGQATVTVDDVRNFLIPFPDESVQESIVKKLVCYEGKNDKLRLLLNQELELRKKQYEYYRNSLLECNDPTIMKPLQDVCKLVTGATPSKTKKEYWENGTIPWMSSGEVNNKRIYATDAMISELGYKSTSTTMVPVHTVVMALAGQGKTRGKVAVTEIELCTNQSLCSIICGPEISYNYLYYYLDSRYEELRSISNGDGTRGGLSLRILNPYKIPVPSLDEQKNKVEIMMKMEKLFSSMFEVLEREIDVRQRQYEYYRDNLLTFSESA